MRIGLFTVPGRFPTTVHDPGAWWDGLHAAGHDLIAHNLNARWWEQALGQGTAVAALRSGAAFAGAGAYCEAIADLDRCVAAANRRELDVDLATGPRMAGVDLADSARIAAAARAAGPLADGIALLLADLPPLDLVLLRATSAAEVATAAIVANLLRALQPGVHVCLAEHSYENYSLRHHLPALERRGALTELFDTIVAEADDVPALVPWLAEQLGDGNRVRGVLRNAEIGAATPHLVPPTPHAAAKLLAPLFAPEPVVHLRLSAADCYWGRCTFCTQNSKYAASLTARKQDIAGALDRVSTYLAAGCRTIVFTDEAIAPAMLGALADAVVARGLRFRWAARCKLERSYDADLLARCAAAGCRELLFGLESIAPNVLAAMDKHEPGQDVAEVAAIFGRVAAAGIGLHVNLINGFPGESVEEAWATARFVGATLATLPNATFGLNPFTVFPATPIATHPERFGIAALHGPGDMPDAFAHLLTPPFRRRTAPAVAAFDDLQAHMETSLGWTAFLHEQGGRTAFTLYSATGHGVLLKAEPRNPLDAARRMTARPSTAPRRRHAFLTGASGVVGGAVLAELHRRGWRTTALVRDPFASVGLADDYVLGDLYDLPRLDDLLAGVDAIIHCASPRSLDRDLVERGEIEATGHLLDAWSSGAFVYCSSQTVYGVADAMLDEHSLLAPDTWYDRGKVEGERLLDAAAAAMAAPGAALRLPLIFSAVATPGRGNYLIELGDALHRDAGFVIRDAGDGSVWMGAGDAARALLAAAEGEVSGAFPVASGFVTWLDLLQGLGEALGRVPRVSVGAGAAGDYRMPRSRTEYRTARFDQATGFRPETDLATTLRAFAAAYRSRPESDRSATTRAHAHTDS